VNAGDELTYELVFDNTDGTAPAPIRYVDWLTDVLDDAELLAGPIQVTGAKLSTEFTESGDGLLVTGELPRGAKATVSFTVKVKPIAERSAESKVLNFLIADPCVGENCDTPKPPTNPPSDPDECLEDGLCTVNQVTKASLNIRKFTDGTPLGEEGTVFSFTSKLTTADKTVSTPFQVKGDDPTGYAIALDPGATLSFIETERYGWNFTGAVCYLGDPAKENSKTLENVLAEDGTVTISDISDGDEFFCRVYNERLYGKVRVLVDLHEDVVSAGDEFGFDTDDDPEVEFVVDSYHGAEAQDVDHLGHDLEGHEVEEEYDEPWVSELIPVGVRFEVNQLLAEGSRWDAQAPAPEGELTARGLDEDSNGYREAEIRVNGETVLDEAEVVLHEAGQEVTLTFINRLASVDDPPVDDVPPDVTPPTLVPVETPPQTGVESASTWPGFAALIGLCLLTGAALAYQLRKRLTHPKRMAE
jgi:hypothetical protein